MADLIHEFQHRVEHVDGRHFTVRVLGEETPDGHWDGFIEFLPAEGGLPLKTDRETTQDSRIELTEWALSLDAFDRQGALRRAEPPHPTPHPPHAQHPPHARPRSEQQRAAEASRPERRARPARSAPSRPRSRGAGA